VFQELVERARCLLIALFVCLSAVFSSAPVGAVPIARGLPTLAIVLDEASPNNVGPISFLDWVSKDYNSDKPPHLITLSPFGLFDPDGFLAVATKAEGVNVSTH
jgi:hypothetical protein